MLLILYCEQRKHTECPKKIDNKKHFRTPINHGAIRKIMEKWNETSVMEDYYYYNGFILPL